ncbi:MAG: hypothetical protein PVJ11_08105 [Syntrophobacterales bacterium]|jgi:hypothetical protein
MKYFKGVALCFLVFVLHFGMLGVENAYAAEKADSTGWEKEGVYNRLYRVDQYQKIKGTLVEIIEIKPMPGMAPGMGLIMISRKKEKVTVHLGPKWFVHFLMRGFKPGDSIKVKGAWAQIKGERFFIASKVRNAEFFEVKFRKTKDGTPYWTMTPEEIINSDERLED